MLRDVSSKLKGFLERTFGNSRDTNIELVRDNRDNRNNHDRKGEQSLMITEKIYRVRSILSKVLERDIFEIKSDNMCQNFVVEKFNSSNKLIERTVYRDHGNMCYEFFNVKTGNILYRMSTLKFEIAEQYLYNFDGVLVFYYSIYDGLEVYYDNDGELLKEHVFTSE
ncbi:hypothetical protein YASMINEVIRUS_419 [Yasminevirus sp. GU-2018]|uniref:Uncharacterized protein n=1 Tax=Yasminevirus sp. GU-2018 TaxID=2420051 RepID=A0A5K0UA40_9VIRU|nr:hypothetical protein YASMINEVIRUS_419 [Yasminevirus sp. GU-2018]